MTDPYSKRRLDVLRETNVQQARGYAQHLEGTTEGALLAFPAQELVRIEDREHPRDWIVRWHAAGGRFSDGGRMIALKGDPIWTKISRFGTPWPPFDFNSGMGVEDIDRDEAISLGLIGEDDPPPEVPDFGFNDDLEAELPQDGIAETDKMLRETFGDQVDIRGTTAHWNAGLIRGMFRGTGKGNAYLGKGGGTLLEKIGDEALAQKAGKSGLTISRQWMATHGVKHKTPSGKAETNLPLAESDYELIPAMWRYPQEVSVYSKDEITIRQDTMDGGTLVLGVNVTTGSPTTFRKEKAALAPSSAQTAHTGRRTKATNEGNQAHQPPEGKENP